MLTGTCRIQLPRTRLRGDPLVQEQFYLSQEMCQKFLAIVVKLFAAYQEFTCAVDGHHDPIWHVPAGAYSAPSDRHVRILLEEHVPWSLTVADRSGCFRQLGCLRHGPPSPAWYGVPVRPKLAFPQIGLHRLCKSL